MLPYYKIFRIQKGCLVGGLFLLCLAHTACGEQLYRWKTKQGALFFSNVTHPENVPFQIIFTGANRKKEGFLPETPKCLPVAVSPVSVRGDGVPDRTLQVLRRRIDNRKKEIYAMEQRLINRNTDERLRRNLMRKRRYLAEELRCLAKLKL